MFLPVLCLSIFLLHSLQVACMRGVDAASGCRPWRRLLWWRRWRQRLGLSPTHIFADPSLSFLERSSGCAGAEAINGARVIVPSSFGQSCELYRATRTASLGTLSLLLHTFNLR